MIISSRMVNKYFLVEFLLQKIGSAWLSRLKGVPAHTCLLLLVVLHQIPDGICQHDDICVGFPNLRTCTRVNRSQLLVIMSGPSSRHTQLPAVGTSKPPPSMD